MWENQTKEKWQFLVRFSEAILKFGLQTRNIKLQHNLFVCTELWENQTCLKEIVCVYSKSRHRETIQSNFIWGTVKLCLYMLTLTIPFSILLLYISSVPSENLSILLYFIKTGDTEDIARWNITSSTNHGVTCFIGILVSLPLEGISSPATIYMVLTQLHVLNEWRIVSSVELE